MPSSVLVGSTVPVELILALNLIITTPNPTIPPDLEKAASCASGANGASGASGACGHAVVNHAILRTF